MNDRKRVLIVSSSFPPTGGSGVQRVVGFVKYLPAFGWDPYVLTIVPGPYHTSGSPQELPRDFPADRVTRTTFFDIRLAGKKLLLRLKGKGAPSTPGEVARTRATGERSGNLLWKLANSLIFLPDPDIGWLPSAVRAGVPTIRQSGIDAILSSAPPFTSHLIALRLKRLTGRPWLADFRDPWSQSAHSIVSRSKAIRRPIDRFLEKKVMNSADKITSVSDPIVNAFAKLKVKGIHRKLHVVTNGYDPDEFAGMVHHPPGAFTITYTGSFYGEVRSPVPFMAALAELIKDGALRRDRVRVRIIETFSQGTASLASRFGLSDVLTVRVGISHTEAIQEQVNASVLLLIVGSGADKVGVYTGKLFEYLAARRPILALAPKEGVAAKLIRAANAGVIVNPGNRREIKEAILKYYSEHQRTGSVAYQGKDEVIRKYERPVQVGQLAKVLDSLVSQ